MSVCSGNAPRCALCAGSAVIHKTCVPARPNQTLEGWDRVVDVTAARRLPTLSARACARTRATWRAHQIRQLRRRARADAPSASFVHLCVMLRPTTCAHPISRSARRQNHLFQSLRHSIVKPRCALNLRDVTTRLRCSIPAPNTPNVVPRFLRLRIVRIRVLDRL